jgi:hypothetical protein
MFGKYMDDVITFISLMLIVFLSGLNLYCRKNVCSTETKQYYVYTVVLFLYGLNLYYILSNYNQYNSNTWKMLTLLFIVPIIMYVLMCQKKCNDLFLPTFFIIFPCMMIIFNLYVWLFQ